MAIRTDPPAPDGPADTGRAARDHWRSIGALALFVFVWLSHSPGLVSSNDGSHLALARALVLRGETTIEPERALTLEVDLAERGDLAYSDRPPGTAFAALPAVWLGARLDAHMFERAVGQAKAGAPVDPLPGVAPYLMTYAKRAGPGSPQLVKLIATSIAIGCHAALVGVLGLMLVARLLRRFEFAPDARHFALCSLALASAWGPYSTVLFSHVSAGAGIAGFALGVMTLADERDAAWWVAPLTGLAGAWAIACDYLLLAAVVPAALLAISPRRYLAVLAGTVPIVVATLAYHHAAFGSVLSIGYDHQTNFAFARARGSTFGGDPLAGAWILWGAGRGAGMLVQAPLILLGALALPGSLIADARAAARAAARADGQPSPASPTSRSAWRRLLLAFIPWALLLAAHQTPWGGGTNDHRYLVPCLPLITVGLAELWRRLPRRWGRAGLVVLALGSALLTWRHFLSWHEGEPFARLGLGLAAAACAGVIALLGRAIRQKLWPGSLPC